MFEVKLWLHAPSIDASTSLVSPTVATATATARAATAPEGEAGSSSAPVSTSHSSGGGGSSKGERPDRETAEVLKLTDRGDGSYQARGP